MKKIFFSACAIVAISFAGQAQTVREDESNDNQDRLQQEPPREPQRDVERATAPAVPEQQNTEAQRAAEQKRKAEIERSTGQPAKNPAKKDNTVPEPRLSQPDSKPLKSN